LLSDAGWFDEDQGTRDAVNGGLPLENALDFRNFRDLTVGLNWHLSSHCRMMLDGIHARISGTGSALIATLRIQIDY